MSNLDEEILEQIRLTNRLLAQILIKDSNSQAERITILYNCGFAPYSIADLLRIKDNIVRATLSKARKAEAKKQ